MVTIVHLITGLDTGGAERMLLRLVARTDRDRFRPVVVSITDAGKIGQALDALGIEFISLSMPRGLPYPRGVFRLARILREVRADILQTWLYHADFLSLLAKPLGNQPHLVWNLRCSNAVLSPAAAAVRRVLSRCSALPDAVIANSRAGRDFHKAIGYRPRRWELIPNGFDTAEFSPDPVARQRVRSQLGIAPEAIVIGLPARYHPMKDHATFLAAAARIAEAQPEVCFLLIGAGMDPVNAPLANAVAGCGLANRVRLLGERADMAAVYAALDIATLSSAWGEGFPNVLGEAMACGLSCAATDVGDVRELLDDCGFVVAPADPAGLAQAWKALIALGAEGRRSFGARARARIVRDYNIGLIVARYEALYSEIAGWSGAAHSWRSAAPPSAAHRAPCTILEPTER
jgi:glycosyltransferase involved in cell wall biosynthesis